MQRRRLGRTVPEREIRVKFSGDTRGLSAAMRDAQRMYQEAQTRAAVLSRQVEDADARIAATQTQRAQTTNVALQQLAQQRIAQQQRERAQFTSEYEKAVRAAEEAEKRLTRTAGEESRKRVQTASTAASVARQAAGGFIGGLGAGPVGGVVGGFIGGVNPIVAAAIAAATGIRASIEALTGAVQQSRELALVLGTTTEQASRLVAIGQQLGVSADSLSVAMRTMAVATENSPEIFQALGVALQDTDGKARPLIDVFNDVRDRLARAGNDTRLMAYAQALFGRSILEILPLIRANADRVRELGDEAERSGSIIGDTQVDAATRWSRTLQTLQMTLGNVGQAFATMFVPLIVNGALLVGQAFDAIGSSIREMQKLAPAPPPGFVTGGAGIEAIKADLARRRAEIEQMLGGPIQFPWERDPRAGGRGGAPEAERMRREQLEERGHPLAPTTPWEAIERGMGDAATRAAELRRRMQEFVDSALGLGKGPVGEGLPPMPKEGDADGAKRRQIDLIRSQMDAIREVADARTEAIREALEGEDRLRQSQIETAEQQRRAVAQTYEARVEQIREEQRALDRLTRDRLQAINDELEARDRLRAVETKALQEQISALDASDKAQQDAAALTEATASLEEERTKDVRRVRSESLDDYRRRVQQHNDELRRLEENLARVQTEQAKRAARESLQARIEAIGQAGEADKSATADRVQRIQREQQARKDQADDEIAQLGKEAAARDQAFARAIANLEALRAASKLAADQQIADVRRYTEEWLRNLQKQIDAIEGRSRAVPPGFVLPGGAPVGAPVFAPVPGGGLPSQTGTFGGVALTSSTQAFFKSIGMAGGGEILLREPAALVGLNSGRPIAVGGEAGPELVSFGSPRGSRQTVAIFKIDGREFARAVARGEYREYRGEGGPD